MLFTVARHAVLRVRRKQLTLPVAGSNWGKLPAADQFALAG